MDELANAFGTERSTSTVVYVQYCTFIELSCVHLVERLTARWHQDLMDRNTLRVLLTEVLLIRVRNCSAQFNTLQLQ